METPEFTFSSTKHQVNQDSIMHVMAHYLPLPGTANNSNDPTLEFAGLDQDGVAIHVTALARTRPHSAPRDPRPALLPVPAPPQTPQEGEEMSPKMDPTRNPYPIVDLEQKEIHLHDGRRLTDKIADDISEEITRNTRRGRGRPSLTGTDEPAAKVTFRLTPRLRSLVDARAKREQRKVSEIAREALEVFLTGDEPAPRHTAVRKTAARKTAVRTSANKASKSAVKKVPRKR